MHRIVFFLILLFCLACKTPQESVETPVSGGGIQAPYQADKDQILFFNFLMQQKKGDKKANILLVKTIESEGKIKRDLPRETPFRPGQLLCSFINQNGEVEKQTAIDHPLRKRYEYQNDDGELVSKIVESTEGQFTIRTQYTHIIQAIRFEEVDEAGQLQLVQLLKFQ